MAAISGVGGKVTAAGVTLANIKTWQVTGVADTTDTTAFGATGSWKTNVATVKHWTGLATANFDSADTTGQVALINGLGSTFAMVFFTDGTHNWAGSASLTTLTPKSAATGIAEVEFQFTGSGSLTYT